MGSVAFATFCSPPHRLSLMSAVPVADSSSDVAPYGLVLKSERPTSSASSEEPSSHVDEACRRRRRREPAPDASPALPPAPPFLHCEPAGRLNEPETPLLSAGAVWLDAPPPDVSHGSALLIPIERPAVCTCTAASPATSDLPMAPLSPLVTETSCAARRRACSLAAAAALRGESGAGGAEGGASLALPPSVSIERRRAATPLTASALA